MIHMKIQNYGNNEIWNNMLSANNVRVSPTIYNINAHSLYVKVR